jgi:hypothetical protein
MTSWPPQLDVKVGDDSDDIKEWGFPSLTVHRGSVLLGFSECTTNLGSCAASFFIARRDRGALPTGKGGTPDHGASWITRETKGGAPDHGASWITRET